MGLFDNIRCEYPLPGNPIVDEWQTKDTPAQYLDTYVIKEDGTLWHEEYDTIDGRSPEEKARGGIIGLCTHVNHRLVQVSDFRSCIVFYGGNDAGESWAFSALFDDGKLLSIKGGKE